MLRAVHLSVLTLLLVAIAINAQSVLTAPTLSPAQLEDCKTLNGLTSLAGTLKVPPGQDAPASVVGEAAQYWIWGYPLLNMAMATVTTGIQKQAINKLVGEPTLVSAHNQRSLGIVTPNVDTLYVNGWLDLSKGPAVLQAPDTQGRFYVLQLLDYWTNVIANPGSPSTGTAASKWVVLPPGAKKESLPTELRGVQAAYHSNTTAVWVIGRVYVQGASDLPAARAVQAGIRAALVNPASAQATRLSDAATTALKLLKDGKWSLRSVGNATSAFVAIAGLAKAFPAPAATAAPGHLASGLGLQPDMGFDQPQITPQQAAVLRAGFSVGQACINAYAVSGQLGVSLPTGWSFTTKAGLYGSDYLLRAAVALIGLGANTPEVTIYGINTVDDKKQPLSGADGAVYTITFPTIPPAKFFSSLTAYATSDNMLMANSYSSRSNIDFKATPGLQFEQDGSLRLWLSAQPPGPQGSKQYANWLPIAEEPFYVVLRSYGPSQELIDGKFPLPAFIRVT